MKRYMICSLCGGTKGHTILYRKQMPINQNTLFDDSECALKCQKKDLKIKICEKCGFVFNDYFDNTVDLYSHNYNNAQIAAKDFLSYMKSSIDYMWNNYFLGGGQRRIYEIGCGKNADYIKLIAEKLRLLDLTDRVQIIGFDPATSAYNGKNVQIYPRYFEFEHENCGEMDWLISRHVVEHLDNPLKLFRNVYGLDKKNKNATAFFETPDVEWIFKNHIVFDFFYEHCSLFSRASILKVGEILGIDIREIKKVFGGQYMWIFMKNQPYVDNNEFDESLDNLLQYSDEYIKYESLMLEKIHDFVMKKIKKGKVAVRGGGAKGNTFLNLFDPNGEMIDLVIDANEEKWGKYIAGTGHSIKSPDILEEEDIKTVIVMNDNYYNEIVEEISERDTKVESINAIDMLLKEGK